MNPDCFELASSHQIALNEPKLPLDERIDLSGLNLAFPIRGPRYGLKKLPQQIPDKQRWLDKYNYYLSLFSEEDFLLSP